MHVLTLPSVSIAWSGIVTHKYCEKSAVIKLTTPVFFTPTSVICTLQALNACLVTQRHVQGVQNPPNIVGFSAGLEIIRRDRGRILGLTPSCVRRWNLAGVWSNDQHGTPQKPPKKRFPVMTPYGTCVVLKLHSFCEGVLRRGEQEGGWDRINPRS